MGIVYQAQVMTELNSPKSVRHLKEWHKDAEWSNYSASESANYADIAAMIDLMSAGRKVTISMTGH